MSHFNYKSFLNPPDEAKPKVKKPVGHTDDSHVKDYDFRKLNAPNTPPHFLNNGEPYGDTGGQLEVKNAAALLKRGIEIAAAPINHRSELIRASLAEFADQGTLDAGPRGDVGTRPAYSRDKEAEVMGADYSEDDMDKMEPVGHIGEATSYLDDVSGCQNCDDGKCEACRGNFNRAMAHLSRFAEKVGAGDGDEDDESIGDPDGSKLEETKKTYAERVHASDLQRDAVRISSNASIKSKQGQGHFGGFPARK